VSDHDRRDPTRGRPPMILNLLSLSSDKSKIMTVAPDCHNRRNVSDHNRRTPTRGRGAFYQMILDSLSLWGCRSKITIEFLEK